jgi:large subunit ribosomal protein L13
VLLRDPRNELVVSTYSPKASEIERAWHVIDAEGMVLGRLKHKPSYTPHLDTGDHVVVINAAKIVLTKNKAEDKFVYSHSGYPGGLKTRTYSQLLASKPEEAVRRTIRGMVPHTRLGAQQLTKLKVYAGPTHPHAAQQPTELVIEHARARTA